MVLKVTGSKGLDMAGETKPHHQPPELVHQSISNHKLESKVLYGSIWIDEERRRLKDSNRLKNIIKWKKAIDG